MNFQKSLALALLLSAPLAAFAHVHLESSIPAAGSTVKSPDRLVLVFQEAVELKELSVQKAGDKAPTALELPKVAAEQLAVPMPSLADGDYTVSYTYVGPDEHRMSSTLKFRVSANAAAGTATGKGMDRSKEHMEHMHQMHGAQPAQKGQEVHEGAGGSSHDHPADARKTGTP